MTSILKIKNASFKFKELNGILGDEYCNLSVIVKKKKYISNEIYYDISYTCNYSSDSEMCLKLNPLANVKSDIGVYQGDIVFSNEMSDSLIKYLLMPFEELEKYSGRVTAEQYKKQIIVALSLFWD